MLEAVRLGGWGMYPTLIFGALSIVAAVSYARSPERRRLALVGILSGVTLLAGLLGFTTGLMVSLSAAAGLPNQGELIALGTFESLNNVGLALMLLVISGLVAAVGAWRSGADGDKPASAPNRVESSA